MTGQIVTAQLHLAASSLREPTESDLQTAAEALRQLEVEVQALGSSPAAAPIHSAMGRVWIDRLGDPRSAAVCFQNAFLLDPRYRPNLEAARRLFASEGRPDRALALHEREGQLLTDPAARAESLRAQARLLATALQRPEEAALRIQEALRLQPDHPALLQAAIDAALAQGDKTAAVKLLLRSASATKDDVQRALILRHAVLVLEELKTCARPADPTVSSPPVADGSLTATELDELLAEALHRLHGADPSDSVAVAGLIDRARETGAWDEVRVLCRAHAERTGAAADRLLVAQICAYKLSRPEDALAELHLALEKSPRDESLLALQLELIAAHQPEELLAHLAERAVDASDASERADLRIVASAIVKDPLAREQLFSEALAENPGDAAAIALHVRLVAQREPMAASERFVSLGEALEEDAPEEASAYFSEAALSEERAGQRLEAAALARRAHSLAPTNQIAVRTLQRTLPFLGGNAELVLVLEEAAATCARSTGADLLSRAAAFLSDLPATAELADAQDQGTTQEAEAQPMQRALELAQRAAELSRGLYGPRGMEPWAILALRAGDLAALGRALEARADATPGADSTDLLLEAAEIARVRGDDLHAASLLRRARNVDVGAASIRRALLLLPALPLRERIELLAEETASSEGPRAAALQAERAALLELDGKLDEAVHACGLALSAGGVDLAVLRRLARIQKQRGDLRAAVEVLGQLAQALPEGSPRAEALLHAAEIAEWGLLDAARAEDLYDAAVKAGAGMPIAISALVARLRLLNWHQRHRDAADAAELLADLSQGPQRCEALRLAASLRANRTGEPARAAALYLRLVEQEPGDLEAMAALLALDSGDLSSEGRKKRAELRGKLASRCQDPRLAASLRAESAEDRLAAGERDQGVAEYRRALALNPYDRIALDVVEESLRASRQPLLLAEHLAFRCAYEDGATRAALALQQAEIFAADGQLDKAALAYKQALVSDPSSLLAVRGARAIAEKLGDRAEVMRLHVREAGLAHDQNLAAGSLIEAALLAEDLGDQDEAAHHLSSVLEYDPSNDDVARRLRRFFPDTAAQELVQIYQRVGGAHTKDAAGAAAWLRAGRLQLGELEDAQAAYISAGRALARQGDCSPAMELRADAAEQAARWADAVEALDKRLGQPCTVEQGLLFRRRLAVLLLDHLGEAEKALQLVSDQLDALPVTTLVKLSVATRSLEPPLAAKLYRRLLESYPAPIESLVTRSQLAEWTDELGRACLTLGEKAEALAAFRQAVAFEPGNRAALQNVAELSSEAAPAEAVAAYRQLFQFEPLRPEPLCALIPLFQRLGRNDAAFCAAGTLVGLGGAGPVETAVHQQVVTNPPSAELPQLGNAAALRAHGDDGAARELLEAAAAELEKALPTALAGRGDRVKGDNPVRRICAALARALGMAEPALYVAKTDPAIVIPVAAEASGLLVGNEVPKRFVPRQQRFLYGRSLAAVHRGTHMLWGFSAARLEQVVAELVRLCAPPGADLARLPPMDVALFDALTNAFTDERRAQLVPLAARVAVENTTWETLRLGIRESAERAGLVLCGDPAAAIGLVMLESPGAMMRPEVARLARFALSEEFLALRVQ